MKFKVFIHVFSLVLVVNFCYQQVTTFEKTIAQIEMDADADSEKEEAESEKETDKLNHHPTKSKFSSLSIKAHQAIHYADWWTSPIIETSNPPPEQG